ncbi:MAG: alpha/beta hydrolase [Robiginitomaculum sp.]|nr:alpha/beta hydrolase [Robiginitomaculum sp.]
MQTVFTRNKNIVRTHKPVKGGTMSAVHFGPLDQPVKLVFLNANGFHGLSYRTILEPLGVHVIGLDLRGHGHTHLPLDKNFASFHHYAKDVINYLEAHMTDKIVLAGHSLGASSAILAAQIAPDKISKVLAFDPIVLPIYVRMMMKTNMGRNYLCENFPMAKMAGNRRGIFKDHQTAFNRYRGRGTFKQFSDEALWDYVCGGFIQKDDHVRLACRPEWEQYTYVTQSHNLKKAIKGLPAHSRIMITDFVPQGKWIGPMKKRRPDIRIDHLRKQDHFFPLMNPEISVPALREILGG